MGYRGDTTSVLPNNTGGAVVRGQLVASSALGAVLADASDNTRNCIGLVGQAASASEPVNLQLSGDFFLSDWTAITGGASLTPNELYFLSTTAGQLTLTPPSVVGEVVQLIGMAITAKTLRIEIQPSVLL